MHPLGIDHSFLPTRLLTAFIRLASPDTPIWGALPLRLRSLAKPSADVLGVCG